MNKRGLYDEPRAPEKHASSVSECPCRTGGCPRRYFYTRVGSTYPVGEMVPGAPRPMAGTTGGTMPVQHASGTPSASSRYGRSR